MSCPPSTPENHATRTRSLVFGPYLYPEGLDHPNCRCWSEAGTTDPPRASIGSQGKDLNK